MTIELLERDLPLATLSDLLSKVNAEGGWVALVSGEAGIGKSAFIERFAREQQKSVRVLWGACDLLFAPRPLGPLHDMAVQLGGEWTTRLNSGDQPVALFTAFLAELQQHPTVAIFEDVHWADEATLDLLKFLARRIMRTSALVVITYRDDEIGAHHPLQALLGDLAKSTAIARIVLASLSKDAVQTLVGQRKLDAAILHQKTAGNPFFVTETIATDTGGIPPTIRDAILARAHRLSLSGQAVLQAAAVIGPRIEPGVLADVTGAEASAAEECLAMGMLVAQGGDSLAFRHELARQTILETIPLPRRLALHRMTLEALRTSPITRTDLTRLAHHAEATGDRPAILEFAPAAARQAVAACAYSTALALFELALQHAHDLPPGEHAQLLGEFAVECDTANRRLEAIEARRKASTLWRAADEPLKEGRNLSDLAALLQVTGQKTEAEQANKAALDILEPLTPNLELITAYIMEAWLSLGNNDNQRGIAMAEKGIALAQHFEEEDKLSRLFEIAGLCWLYVDQVYGMENLERALALALKFGNTVRAGNLYANLSSIYVDFHDFARAEDVFAVGLPYARDHELVSVLAFMEGWFAIHKMYRGEWAAAEEVALATIQRTTQSPGRGPALTALGRLRARRGEPDAMTALDESLEILLQQGFRQREGMIRAAQAEAAWLAGDGERTLHEAQAVYDLALSHHQTVYVGELALWRWRAGDAINLPEWTAKPFALQIAGHWRAAAEEWERLGCPYEQACALADGDYKAQVAALAILDRLGARPAAESLRQMMQASGASVIPRGPRAVTRDNPFSLTNRQLEILTLLAAGLTNAEIAAQVYLSQKTVDHHVSAILAKLDVHSRKDAADLVRQHPHFQKPR